MRSRALAVLLLTACADEPPAGDSGPAADADPGYPEIPALDAAIEAEMAASHIPGVAACLIADGETTWCGGYGYADIEAGLEVTPTTPFMIASVSKTVAAVALMQRHEAGDFDLDDPIDPALPFSVVHPDDPTPITYRMLLTHSSGIVDNWNVMDSLYVDGDSPIGLGEFMADYLDPDGAWYDPDRNYSSQGVGARTLYSNIGASLAAYMVEPLTGIPFDDYCDDAIFAPLEMEDTSWHLADLDPDLVAVPYDYRGGAYIPMAHYGYPDYPDGQLRTGAEQLSRFLAMFAAGGVWRDVQLLAPETVAEMSRTQDPSLDSSQGLIWYSWSVGGASVLGHNGGDWGVSAEMGFREDGVGFVVLMNGEGTNWSALSTIEEAMLAAADTL